MNEQDKAAFVGERLDIYNHGKRDAITLMRDFAHRFKGVDGEEALRSFADVMTETLDKLEAEHKS